jgi:hypothetical protein
MWLVEVRFKRESQTGGAKRQVEGAATYEVDSDGRHEASLERVIGKAHHEGRLSNTGVTFTIKGMRRARNSQKWFKSNELRVFVCVPSRGFKRDHFELNLV